MSEDVLPPSKVQQYVSELFRLSLCRSDDVKLTYTNLQKPLLKSSRTV